MLKLNLGSGGHLLHGWHNLDKNPTIISESEIYLIHDLRTPLHYSDNTVSYIYSEHFIEHLDEVDGYNLMKECHRILKSGGIVRFSCPDLKQYVETYLNWTQNNVDNHLYSSGANYLNYAILGEAREGLKYLSPISKSQDEGHRYYYDETELRNKLSSIGFIQIERCSWGQSKYSELQNLEWRSPRRDLIVEAKKS